jgi:hypothetical protein
VIYMLTGIAPPAKALRGPLGAANTGSELFSAYNGTSYHQGLRKMTARPWPPLRS